MRLPTARSVMTSTGKFKTLKLKFFPGFYLFVERYIFNSVETSQHTFREALYHQFASAINGNPALKIIFMPPAQQVTALYRRFLLSAAARTHKVTRSGSGVAEELTQLLNNTTYE